MAAWILAFFSGDYLLQYFSRLPSVIWLLLVVIALLIMIGCCAPKRLRGLLILSLAVVLGFSYAYLNARWILAWKLPQTLVAKSILISGHIASLPESQSHRTSFLFVTQSIAHKAQSARLRLTWYGKHPPLYIGDQWQLQVRLKQPRSTLNPNAFDYERWLFHQHIRAIGYVRKSQQNQLIASKLWHSPVGRLRQWLDTHIHEQLANQAMSGIVTALAIGSRSGIQRSQWLVFRDTGTSHLVAISGLHIGLVAGLMFWLVNFTWRRSARLLLIFPSIQAAAVAAFIAAIIYSALAGFSLPTQRALVMIAVFMTALLLRRHVPPWYALIVALLLVILLDPFAPLSPGFWLSFGAVALIIYGLSARVKPTGIWWKWCRTQWVVSMGLLPLTVALFQQASLVSFFANLIAIPWVGFTVVPLSLLGSLLLLISAHVGGWVLYFAAKAMALLWPILHYLASIHGAVWRHGVTNHFTLITAFVGVLLLLAPKGLPNRWIGLFWLFPLVFYRPAAPNWGDLNFTLLDVGQGLAVVVRTQHHVLVYDTGPKYGPNFDTGSSVVVPYLRGLGVSKVNMLVISHGHNDHMGGAQSLVQQIPTAIIATTVPKRLTKARYCYTGEKWHWDGVQFEFLYPPKTRPKLYANDSCVLRIDDGKTSILLTGDIEKAAEKYLVTHEFKQLQSTILVVPHHGSKTSSTAPFIAAVKAKYALFPMGYQNRFRHPNAQVYQRHKNSQAILLDSVKDGAIVFKISKSKGIEAVSSYRKQYGRFWNY